MSRPFACELANSARPALWPVLLALLSCTDGQGAAAVSRRDSAGVRIVENRASDRRGDAWRIALDPSVSIGTLAGGPAYELDRVRGATRLGDGTIAVLDGGTRELRLYDAQGVHQLSVGREGDGPGEFRTPVRLFRIVGDTLLVWDSGLARLTIFDRHGAFVRSLSLAVGEATPTVLGVFSDRTVLVSMGAVFTPASEPGPRRDSLRYTRFDLTGHRVAEVGSFPDMERFVRNDGGRMTMAPLVLGRTTTVTVSHTHLYVGTNDRFSVDEYDLTGRHLRSLRRGLEPSPTTEQVFRAERERRLSRIPEQLRGGMNDLYETMPRPESLPYYSALVADGEGHVWVRHFSVESAQNGMWTVFEPSGRARGPVETPVGLEIYEIGADYVLGRWTDALDAEYVRVHRLRRGTRARRRSYGPTGRLPRRRRGRTGCAASAGTDSAGCSRRT